MEDGTFVFPPPDPKWRLEKIDVSAYNKLHMGGYDCQKVIKWSEECSKVSRVRSPGYFFNSIASYILEGASVEDAMECAMDGALYDPEDYKAYLKEES